MEIEYQIAADIMILPCSTDNSILYDLYDYTFALCHTLFDTLQTINYTRESLIVFYVAAIYNLSRFDIFELYWFISAPLRLNAARHFVKIPHP